jgi:hypothetical protein
MLAPRETPIMAETIIIYRLPQAPRELTRKLPKKAGPWRCLFWVARDDSQATASLFKAVPEPDIDHVAEALSVASAVGKYLVSAGRIPTSVRPRKQYSVGFHSADADDVEAYLREAGHNLVPISELDVVRGDEAAKQRDPSEVLYFAAMKGDEKGCKQALKQGAKLGFKNHATGATALHEAASAGHTKVVSLLLGAGADVNGRLKNAMTPPLGMAIDGGHLPGVKRLLKAGAKTDVLYGRARATPVHAAVSQGAPKILAALIEAGADVNGRSKGGKSALEVAIQEGHDPKKAKRSGGLIAQLLAAGADPKEKNDSGESAIDLARSLGRAHLEQYLTAKT